MEFDTITAAATISIPHIEVDPFRILLWCLLWEN